MKEKTLYKRGTLLISIVILTMILGLVPHNLSFAATKYAVTKTHLSYRYGNAYGGNSYGLGFSKYKINGKEAFCMDPYTLMNSDKKTYSKKASNLTKAQWDEIAMIANIGYNSKRSNDAWYCTTQMLIWKKLIGWKKVKVNGQITIFSDRNTISGYADKKKTIEKELSAMKSSRSKNISFHKQVVTGKEGEKSTVTLTDTNKVLSSGYKVQSTPSGVTASIDGNKLNINISETASNGTIKLSWSANKPKIDDKTYYYSPSSQDVASTGQVADVNASVSVKLTSVSKPVDSAGALHLNKAVDLLDHPDHSLFSDPVDLSEIQFDFYAAEPIKNAAGEVVYQKDQLIQTIHCQKDGDLEIGKILPGQYYLKERKTLPGLVTNDLVYPITAKKGANGTVDVDIDTQVQELVEYENEDTGEIIRAMNLITINTTDELWDETVAMTLAQASAEKFTKDDPAADAGEDAEAEKEVKETSESVNLFVDLSEVDPKTQGSYSIRFYTEAGTSIQTRVLVNDPNSSEAEFEDTIYNDTTKVAISKSDLTGENEIEGAKMILTDQNGSLVDQWTSTQKSHLIEGLIAGETYTLKEEIAPDGYVISSDAITFTVEDTAAIQTQTMKNMTAGFRKVDEEGNLLNGANIQIIDEENGNLVEEFTTDYGDGGKSDKVYYLSGLVEGKTYLVHETSHPDEYMNAEDISFTLSPEGNDEEGVKHTSEGMVITMIDRKCSIGTQASVDGKKVAVAAKDLIIQDQILYENFNVGETVIATAQLMDPDGKPIKISGKEVTATKEFTPSEEEGTVTVEIPVDSSTLAKKEVVVYEEIRSKEGDRLVAKHQDSTDKGQTVRFQAPKKEDKKKEDEEKKETPRTGDGFAIKLLLAAIILSGGTTAFALRKREE